MGGPIRDRDSGPQSFLNTTTLARMRILITGARGLIGQRVMRRLCAQGHEVYAMVSTARPLHQKPAPGVPALSVDLFDELATRTAVTRLGATHLIHLAWITNPHRYRDDPINHGWIGASLNLLESFAQGGGRHAFFAGSCAEYDWSQGGCLSAGTTPLHSHTLYGQCKASLSRLAPKTARLLGIDLAWGRIAFPFGPHEHPERLVSSLIQALLRQEPARCGPGAIARDFIYVDDLADMIVLIVQQSLTGEWDLGSGQPTTVAEMACHLQRLTQSVQPALLGALPARPDEPSALWSDARRIRAAGWKPRLGLEGGLRRCVALWRTRCTRSTPRNLAPPHHD
jgi:nucleoside-diphosphate-sugar epimerase